VGGAINVEAVVGEPRVVFHVAAITSEMEDVPAAAVVLVKIDTKYRS
jgi:hypothetical protein